MPPIRRPPPRHLAELMLRAEALAGRRLAELAHALAFSLEGTPQRTKGRIGQLLEHALGASAGNATTVDFPDLGVELKTVPVDREGRPRESTFVCTLDLESASRATWATSTVRARLSQVLFVPICVTDGELGARTIGRPQLFCATAEQLAILQSDFDDLVGAVGAGAADTLTAHQGRWLQLRPKAQNGAVRTLAPDDEGGFVETGPRAFYLRRAFVAAVLTDAAALPAATARAVGVLEPRPCPSSG